MKLAIAAFHIESVSFLPEVATYEQFNAGALRGENIVNLSRGTNSAIGGFVDFCEANDIEIEPIVVAFQGAVGPASDEAVARYTFEMIDALAQCRDEIDGVLLHLHGAAATPSMGDPDAFMIGAIRDVVGADIPIMVAFDFHGNIGASTVDQADAAFGYQCSPHTDMNETGQRTAGCMFKTLNGVLSPHMAVLKPDVLIPTICSATHLPELAKIMAHARHLEEAYSGYLDVSVMAGFPYSDSSETGFSVIAVSDQAQTSREIATELCQLIREQKEALYRAVELYSVGSAIDYILENQAAAEKPFLILEHADRMNDSTYTLQALVQRGVGKTYAPFIWDPETAGQCFDAGEGAEVNIALGGKSGDKTGPTLALTARVVKLGPSEYTITGPVFTGFTIPLGKSVLLDVGGILISVVSHPAMAFDTDPLTIFGLTLDQFDVIVLRSKTHFRKVYEPLVEKILVADTPDYGPADVTTLPYQRLNTNGKFPFSER